MNIYTPKYFKAYELVPPAFYNFYREESFFIFNQDLLRDLDTLREIVTDNYGGQTRAIVNDWRNGGNNSHRGYRFWNSAVGARFSEHKRGNAFDVVFTTASAEDVRKLILRNQSEFLSINRLEKCVSWVHLDGRDVNRSGIYLFNGGACK